ncbi:MAG: response regulator [Eubacteriales bacterium]|nr:response regulator [Eubacteriales bacterium]
MYSYLIIDDEELIRKGTIKKLSTMGDIICCIGEAENGAEGIEKIEVLHPDMVILDMQMPVMDGTQLLPYLSQHYPGLPLIVISGYRDFDYVKHAISAQAIDYILKPFSREAIQKCVRDAISRLESHNALENHITSIEEEKEAAYYEYDQQILKNLILGYHTDTTVISSQKLNFINRTHNLILMTIYGEHISSEAEIRHWIEENEYSDWLLYLSHPNDKHMGFLLLLLPDQSPFTLSQLSRQAGSAFLSFSKSRDFVVLIGVSREHSKLEELGTAFEEASEALNRRTLTDVSCKCWYYEDTEPKIIEWDKLEEFLFRIESGMASEVEALTKELFRHFLSIPDFTLADAKYYCYFLSNQCRMILNEYLNQKDISSVSNSMQNIVTRLYLLEDLENYYQQFFVNLANMLKSQSVYAVDDVIEKIKIYMEKNYQKNLTQDFISYLFYLNRSYLSTLFKARTGQKFIDHLNEIRIEKAKELLAASDKKMYQISKSVGYDNVKYFFRIFKKKTGLTPEQYRLQNGKMNGTSR